MSRLTGIARAHAPAYGATRARSAEGHGGPALDESSRVIPSMFNATDGTPVPLCRLIQAVGAPTCARFFAEQSPA